LSQLAAFVQGLAVVLCIQEELGLTDDAVRPAQTREQVVDVDHLIDRVGRQRLLAITERRVGDHDVAVFHRGEIELNGLAVDVFDGRSVEPNPRRQVVGEDVLQQVRPGHLG
jgi:hypothetical protein